MPSQDRLLNAFDESSVLLFVLPKIGFTALPSEHFGSPQSQSGLRRRLVPALLAIGSSAIATGLLMLLDRPMALNLVPIAYLVPIIFAATQWGMWPAALASLSGMAAADFFFTEPVYSFRIDDPQEVIDLILFFIISLVCSDLASRLRRQTNALRRREAELQRLYGFSRRLAACFTIDDLTAAIQDFLFEALGDHTALFIVLPDASCERSGHAPPPALRDTIAGMLASIGASRQTITDAASNDLWLLRAVTSDTAVHGVIAINVGHATGRERNARRAPVEDMLDEISLTLKRLDISRAMDDARLLLQADLLRDAFHGSLSHELISPLSSIQGSAVVLDSIPLLQDNRAARALVDSIRTESARLGDFIHQLLSATRVNAGGLSPRLEWCDPKDIVSEAIRRRAARLSAHEIEIAFAGEPPLLNVDSGLIAEACGQLLENAAKYSPSGSTIAIKAYDSGDRFVLSVTDTGIGISQDEQRLVGRRAYRNPRHQASIPGSGLGVWIASAFVKANGGKLDVVSPGLGLGTTASISLPADLTSYSELADSDDE